MENTDNAMFLNNSMMSSNGMPGQFPYGFNPNQDNFNNGMGFNGMVNGMPNMMGNNNWNMNPMGMSVNYFKTSG